MLLTGGTMVVERYLYEVRHPEDVSASSGMWAFGDAMLFAMLFFMLMAPTFFALRLLARSERTYTAIAKVTLAITTTAPVCLAVLWLAKLPSEGFVTDTLLWRMMLAPFVLIAVFASRIAARFQLAKRLLTWAVLTETLTFVLAVVMFLNHSNGHA